MTTFPTFRCAGKIEMALARSFGEKQITVTPEAIVTFYIWRGAYYFGKMELVWPKPVSGNTARGLILDEVA